MSNVYGTTGPSGDCELLLNATFRLARKLLEEQGEFHPFGMAMKPEGEIVPVALHGESEFPRPEEVVKLVTDAFKAAAEKGEYIATSLAANVRTTLPAGGPTQAVSISLDHKDSYSIIAYIPFERTADGVKTGVLFTQPGSAQIFGRKPS